MRQGLGQGSPLLFRLTTQTDLDDTRKESVPFWWKGRHCGSHILPVRSRPGSQDYVRVGRAKFQARFVDRKSVQVPYPFDGGQSKQDNCFYGQDF